MIQHGAQEIILTCDNEDEDMKANIDNIIEKSMKKTQEIEKQLKSIEDKFNLNNVSLTGEDDYTGAKTCIYQIDGEVVSKKEIYDAKEKKERTFIDIGSRKKPRFQPPPKAEAQNGQKSHASEAAKKKAKGWKALVGGGFDHQFFNNVKLDELEKKENEWIKYTNLSEEEKESATAPPEFTLKDQQQKDSLLKKGFPNWNKRDFFKFINMCELYGKDNYELFSELLLGGKTVEEIEEYANAFWKNYTQIDNYKKYLDRIEKGA